MTTWKPPELAIDGGIFRRSKGFGNLAVRHWQPVAPLSMSHKHTKIPENQSSTQIHEYIYPLVN